MNHKYISLEEYSKKAFAVWFQESETPELARQKVFEFRSGPDVFSALSKGKESLLSELCRYQPKFGELMLSGGDLFVGCPRPIKPSRRKNRPPEGVLALYLEVNGRLVHIGCDSHGSKPIGAMSDCLPAEIKRAYYSDGLVNGLVLPHEILSPGTGRLLPIPESFGWPTIDQCLGWLGMDDQILNIAEAFNLEKNSGAYFGMRVFLTHFTSDQQNYSESDILLVDSKSKSIYHICDGNVGHIRLLENYQEALDNYCCSIIKNSEERFDFKPYLGKKVL